MEEEKVPLAPEMEALARLDAELAAEQKAAEAAQAAREAAAASPEVQALEKRARLDALRRQREEDERGVAEDRAWAEARAKYGARVARLYTAMGWIILKFNTDLQWAATIRRAQDLQAAALEAGDAQKAAQDSAKAFREAIITDSLVHPEAARFREIVNAYPLVWDELYVMRDNLNRGPREAAGKGGAR